MADHNEQNAAETKESGTLVDPSGAPVKPTESPVKKKRQWFITGTIVVLILIGAVLYYLHSRGFEETDDAQVDAHLGPIASRIDGTVKAVYVEDGVYVKAGQPLVDLDDKDTQVALAQAQAKYDQALAQEQGQRPNVPLTQLSNATNVSTQAFEVENAKAVEIAAEHDRDNAAATLQQSIAQNTKAQADYQRYKLLYEKQEASRMDYDNYAATAASQAAAVEGNKAMLASAGKTVDQRKAQVAEQRAKLAQNQQSAPQQAAIQRANERSQSANVEALRAELVKAQLNLQYCHVVAPVSGYTTQRSAEVGSRVSTGQQLIMIAQTDDQWVTANYKETQLAKIRVGQHVQIHVDALSKDFDGSVESLPTITGSRSSVLPAENATGNYVKVVQRLPMRIRFNPGQGGMELLRPGMSAEPTVTLH